MKIKLYITVAFLTSLSLCSGGCGKTLFEYAKNSERGKGSLVEKSVIIDDHRIVYLESGEGETILLVHGFGGDKDNWTRIAPFIGKGYRIIAPDLPGFGESSKVDSASYDIDSQTARLKQFTEALALKKFHLAGNSMGGWISADYAIKHKEQVLTLTLLNSAGINTPKKSELALSLEKGINPLLISDADDFDRFIQFVFVTPPYIPGSVKKVLAEAAVKNRPFNGKIFREMQIGSSNLEKNLKGIKAPTLIIWGDTDRLIDVSAVNVFTRGIRNSRSYILKSCGHLPMIERPEETAGVFIDFIRSYRS